MQAAVVPILPQLSLKRILYATDFSTSSQACLAILGALARRYQAEAYIANVRPPMPYTMATPEAVCMMENQRERAARHDMETLLHSPALHGVATSAIVETGDPAEELRRAVRDYDIDMVVVATHDIQLASECNQAMLLAHAVVAVGPGEEILTPEALLKTFGIVLLYQGEDKGVGIIEREHGHN